MRKNIVLYLMGLVVTLVYYIICFAALFLLVFSIFPTIPSATETLYIVSIVLLIIVYAVSFVGAFLCWKKSKPVFYGVASVIIIILIITALLIIGPISFSREYSWNLFEFSKDISFEFHL